MGTLANIIYIILLNILKLAEVERQAIDRD